MTEGKTTPLVSVIIPTLYLTRPRNTSLKHFAFPLYTIRDVLRDLERATSIPLEVIVVCNGSDPELLEVVRQHPRVDKYVINSTNVGVSRSWNMGAMMSEGEALCFLNDDVAVGPDAIRALFDALKSDLSIGEVGPKGSKWSGANHDRYVGEKTIEDADAISGFMFMLRARLLFEIGCFDTSFTPAGFEEIDLSFSIRKRGYRCVVMPGLDVTHHGRHGVSTSRAPIQYFSGSIHPQELHERNRSYFARKWGIAEALTIRETA